MGSYPNFFFSVKQSQLAEFINAISHAKTDIELDNFYSKYGVRRTNPEIWQQADWFNQQYSKYRGLSAGLLDMSRYGNL
jgi:hypothetical protein